MDIEKATPQHLPGILDVVRANSFEQSDTAERARRGFLVSAFTESDYRRFITYDDHFYVGLIEDSVIGFVLAYRRAFIDRSEWLNWRLREHFQHDFTLIKQVAVHPARIGLGFGVELYEHLLRLTDPLPALAAIVLVPPNEISIRFHERFGFVKIAEGTPPDGMPRGVWAIRMPGLAEHSLIMLD